MKTFEEFVKALETDETLKAKFKAALENAEVKTEEAKIAILVKIATENGYNVRVEDFAKRQAEDHELDEDELGLVSGGYFCNSSYGECGNTFKVHENCWFNDECDSAVHYYKYRKECSTTFSSVWECFASDFCSGAWNHYNCKD